MSDYDAYHRRREQVRRAQRTHRERKAAYVKTLEGEVAQLRAHNATLQDSVAVLREALISRGIPLPASGQSSNADVARVGLDGTGFPDQKLRVRHPSSGSSRQPVRSSTVSYMDLTHPHAVVEFVLSLERCCMYHHRRSSPGLLIRGSPGATGHAAMLSSPVMARAPRFSFNPLKHLGYPPDAQWDVPMAELQQLLRTSQALGLDEDEITPVQVWNVIREREFGYESISVDHLKALGERLLPLVKCAGYGAVLGRAKFEEVYRSMCLA